MAPLKGICGHPPPPPEHFRAKRKAGRRRFMRAVRCRRPRLGALRRRCPVRETDIIKSRCIMFWHQPKASWGDLFMMSVLPLPRDKRGFRCHPAKGLAFDPKLTPGNPPHTHITEKSVKIRAAPILPETAKNLKSRLIKARRLKPERSNMPLFLSRNGEAFARSGSDIF